MVSYRASRNRWRGADDLSQATFPLDVVKTRIQNSVPFGTTDSDRRASILQVIRATHREGGMRPFFAGLGPTLIR